MKNYRMGMNGERWYQITRISYQRIEFFSSLCLNFKQNRRFSFFFLFSSHGENSPHNRGKTKRKNSCIEIGQIYSGRNLLLSFRDKQREKKKNEITCSFPKKKKKRWRIKSEDGVISIQFLKLYIPIYTSEYTKSDKLGT